MKKLGFLLLCGAMCIMQLPAQTTKQSITDLFNEFITCQKPDFSIMPRSKDKLLVSESRYKVSIDHKNYFIRITDETMDDGDGSITSDFTYFGVKNARGIIALTRELYGGDEGGIGDGSNTLRFFCFNKTWNDCSQKPLTLASFKEYAGTTVPTNYNICQYFTVLPQQGTDVLVFAVPSTKFRVYSNSPDDPFSFTYEKNYDSYFTKRKFLAIVYKWNSATGQFTEKERISNTAANVAKYKKFLQREN